MKTTLFVNAPVISENLGLTPIPGWHFEVELNQCRTPWNKGTKGLQVAWNKGRTGCYTVSEETRRKLREKNLGKSLSTEHRAKIGASNRKPKRYMPPKPKWSAERRREGMGIKYKITHPNGHEEIVMNMRLWCEANGISRASMSRAANSLTKLRSGHKVEKL